MVCMTKQLFALQLCIRRILQIEKQGSLAAVKLVLLRWFLCHHLLSFCPPPEPRLPARSTPPSSFSATDADASGITAHADISDISATICLVALSSLLRRTRVTILLASSSNVLASSRNENDLPRLDFIRDCDSNTSNLSWMSRAVAGELVGRAVRIVDDRDEARYQLAETRLEPR